MSTLVIRHRPTAPPTVSFCRCVPRKPGGSVALVAALALWAGMADAARATTSAEAAAPAKANANAPARVRVASSLLDDVVGRLLPIAVPAADVRPGSGPRRDGGAEAALASVVVTDLRSCGVTGRGAGLFRAVVRWGANAVGAATSSALGGDDGCHHGLEQIAADLAAVSVSASPPSADEGVAVVDLEAIWRPCQLQLVVARAAVVAPLQWPAAAAVPALERGRALVSVSTVGLRMTTNVGSVLVFDVEPTFDIDGVEIAAAWGESRPPPGSSPATAKAAGSSPATATATATSTKARAPLTFTRGGNVAIDVPYAFANRLLRQMTGAQPVAIDVQGDVLDVRNVTVAASTVGVTVLGTASPRALRESARVTVQAGGPELRVLSIRADADLEMCRGSAGMLGAFACSARNAARTAAATALGSAMNRTYQGRWARDLAGDPSFRFGGGGAPQIELRGALLHIGTTADGALVEAALVPEAGNGSPP